MLFLSALLSTLIVSRVNGDIIKYAKMIAGGDYSAPAITERTPVFPLTFGRNEGGKFKKECESSYVWDKGHWYLVDALCLLK